MGRISWLRLKNIDWLTFSAIFFLVVISLGVIYGISINPVDPDSLIFSKQLAFATIGLLIFFVMSNINYRVWMTYSKIIYIASAALLLYVLYFGLTIRGTTGWISLGFISFQPVEFAKVGLIIFLAKYFSDYGRQFFLWRHIIISGLGTVLLMVLVLLQPDLGSAIVLFGTWLLMLLIVGISRKQIAILIISIIVMSLMSWFFVLAPYQKDRIVTFINPQSDALGVGYNVRQSIIAVGSGQLLGRGFGLGSQSQLKFLPEAETDFIFAVLGEEFGLIGIVILLSIFFMLMIRLLATATRTTDNFAAFFTLGLASLFIVHSFINIGMNVGIAPVAGIPLPFISAGGSSLISFFIAFGIASNIMVDTRSR